MQPQRSRHRGPAATELIHPQAVQAIVQVVAGRDDREHLLHALALVGDGMGIGQEVAIPNGR